MLQRSSTPHVGGALMSNLKNVGDTVQAFVTAGGIATGAVFTYFKFIKDRVYRPRVHLEVSGGVIDLGDEGHYLLCRATIANQGGTKLSLVHAGTAIIVRLARSGTDVLKRPAWSSGKESAVLDVFGQHDWIESAETISDDVAVRVPAGAPCLYGAEFRLVVAAPSPSRRGNISISTARVIPSAQSWTVLPGSDFGTNGDALMSKPGKPIKIKIPHQKEEDKEETKRIEIEKQ
jgi:hypothetical protein